MNDLVSLDQTEIPLDEAEPAHIHKEGEIRRVNHDVEEYELMKIEAGLADQMPGSKDYD